jgi:hypothetical protein
MAKEPEMFDKKEAQERLTLRYVARSRRLMSR